MRYIINKILSVKYQNIMFIVMFDIEYHNIATGLRGDILPIPHVLTI